MYLSQGEPRSGFLSVTSSEYVASGHSDVAYIQLILMCDQILLQVESHCLLQLKVSCSGGTVASQGDNLRWRIPVDWYTSHKIPVARNLGVERFPDYFLDDFVHGVNIDCFAKFLSGSSGQSSSAFDSASSSGDTVYRSPSPPDYAYALGPPILSPTVQEEKLYFVQSPDSSSAASPPQESSSSSSDVSIHFDSVDLPVHDQEAAHTSAPVDSNVFINALEDLRSSLSQRIHDSNCEILSKVNAVDLGLGGDLLKVQVLLHQSFETACRVLERKSTTQTAQITDLKKGLMAPVGTIFQDLFDIKKRQREQDAKLITMDGQIAAIRSEQLVGTIFQDLFDIKKRQREQDAKLITMDGQIAAIRSEQLDFQSKIAADILSLSTQFADIVDYIRGGDAKKGESGISAALLLFVWSAAPCLLLNHLVMLLVAVVQ
ncbi:hypothetical protein F511_32268 [Dorcoceras hygrometricum]|uniref:Uncharacterized protein n=1 Tax=Dorcoceras hygrometricum TaxID=472368 RepID=A0A2Z7B341_9LAMI|nr:hypothetical protein F511_32268 [Dorcoceras hygrometricum]